MTSTGHTSCDDTRSQTVNTFLRQDTAVVLLQWWSLLDCWSGHRVSAPPHRRALPGREVHLLQERAENSDRVTTCARGRLHEVGVPFAFHYGHGITRQQLATFGLRQVCFAADHGDGRALAASQLQDLVAEAAHHLEGARVVHCVHQGERVAVADAELPHGRERVAPACVQDLQPHLPRAGGVVLQHVKLLHCARVFVLEAVVEETVDECALPDPRRTEEHQPNRTGTS